MGNWNNPTVSTAYSTFLSDLKDRDVDAATLFYSAPTGTIPTGAIKFNRSTNVFQEWSGSAWVDKVLAVAGGGTGASTASGARSNLGLGSIATQAADNVNITGGTIASCDLTYAAETKSIGTNASRLSKIYIRNGAVAPVGTDKYLTS